MSYLEVLEILESIKAYNKNFKFSCKNEDVAQNDREREIIHNDNLQLLKPYLDPLMGLDYRIAKEALKTIISNDKYAYKFNDMPVPTLVTLTIQMTEYSAEEKKKYFDNLKVYYGVDDNFGIMRAYNKATGQHEENKDRPMTAIEEDYYLYYLMTPEEYAYYSGKTEKRPDPDICLYDPKTRTNKNSRVEDLQRNKKIKEEIEERRFAKIESKTKSKEVLQGEIIQWGEAEHHKHYEKMLGS